MVLSDSAERFLNEIYSLGSDEERQAFYAKWADEYDVQVEQQLRYVAPAKTAALFQKYVADTNANILDVGCGTGLTSLRLFAAGYKSVDGLDFSQAMLTKAGERKSYRKLIQADLNQALPLNDDEYDALISSGTFSIGHVGADPLEEIFRVLRSGGLMVCTVHRVLWESQGFKKNVDMLEKKQAIKLLEVVDDIYFEGAMPDCLYCVFQKC